METSVPPPPSAAPATLPAPPTSLPAGGGPQPGQLTPGWRLVVLSTWVLALLAITAVLKASRDLGLSTWWLGPASAPHPIPVVLVPFVAPVAMMVATLVNARRLPWYGLLASAVGAAIAVGDLGRVRRLGLIELAIALACAAVSVASFAGQYRPARRP